MQPSTLVSGWPGKQAPRRLTSVTAAAASTVVATPSVWVPSWLDCGGRLIGGVQSQLPSKRGVAFNGRDRGGSTKQSKA